MKKSIWRRMQDVDSRVIYMLLIVSILVPLFCTRIHYLDIPNQHAKDFYNVIQNIGDTEPDKLVIVDGQWSASTRGENQWQAEAVITHLMMRHIHFATLSFDPQNLTLTEQILDRLAPKYHERYGVDYINWGYRPYAAFPQTIKGLDTDIPGTIQKDVNGVPLSAYPIMANVKSIKDVSAIVEITAGNTIDFWLGLVQGVNHTPLLYAPTAISAPSYYPYLDSGQISGMLLGVKGAGDYENLIHAPSFGTRATGALSFVYALIILLVALGNVGHLMTKREESKRNA